MSYNTNQQLNNFRESYTGEMIDFNRNFFTNQLLTLDIPTTAAEAVHYIDILGQAIKYTYPIKRGDAYEVGQLKVKMSNGYLALIVTLRNVLSHPNDKRRVEIALNQWFTRFKDEDAYDGMPPHFARCCRNLAKIRVEEFVLYVMGLSDSVENAKIHSSVSFKVKIPRGRLHKYPPRVIEHARKICPEYCRDWPEREFQVEMKETLDKLEKNYDGGRGKLDV